MRIEKPFNRRKVLGLTPLIDVVFILLLFFMLSTKFSQQQAIILKVPDKTGVTKSATNTDHLSVRLHIDGLITINKTTTVNMDTLLPHFVLRRALKNEFAVFIDADETVALQAIISLSDTLYTAGFQDVNLRALR
jgi:biopolymer transport protein ExbD